MKKTKINKNFVKEPIEKNKILIGFVALILFLILCYGIIQVIGYSIEKAATKVSIERGVLITEKNTTIDLEIEKLRLEIEKLKLEQGNEPVIMIPNSAIKTKVAEIKPCSGLTGVSIGIYQEGNYSCCKRTIDEPRFKCMKFAEYNPTLWQNLLKNISKEDMTRDDKFIYIKS